MSLVFLFGKFMLFKDMQKFIYSPLEMDALLVLRFALKTTKISTTTNKVVIKPQPDKTNKLYFGPVI